MATQAERLSQLETQQRILLGQWAGGAESAEGVIA